MVALTAPLVVAALVAPVAAFVLLGRGGPAAARGAGAMALGLVAATLVVQSLVLVVGTGASWSFAVAVSVAFAVRLGALLIAMLALAAVLPARAWLAGLRRTPRLALLLSLTFRQVPDLAADAERIRQVQRARGLLAGRRHRAPTALLVPLVTRALDRADRMGRALALAGWGPTAVSPVVRPVWRPLDALWILLGALGILSPLF